MKTDKLHSVNINLSNSTYKNKNLACSVPYAFYNALSIKKTLRYIAAREKIDFDLNSVVRFLVCDTIIDIDRVVPIEQKLDNHFISCKINSQILSKTISILAKYHKTIVKATSSSFHNLGLESPNNIEILTLINNYIPYTNYLTFNIPYLKNSFDNKYAYTGIYSDFLGLTETIDFSPDFLGTNNAVRRLKTKSNYTHKDHVCVIADYSSINISALSRLINYGQSFCITTLANCPLYNNQVHDWIVDSSLDSKAIFDGYIKERKIQCNLPDNTNNKSKFVELNLICFNSQNAKTIHKQFINLNDPDKGWLCFLTNEKNFTYNHIVHMRIIKNIYIKVFNVLKNDFFGNPILTNNASAVLGHYTIFGIAQTILNSIYMILGYPYNLIDVPSELSKYNLRYIDNNIWINNELTKFGRDLFNLIDKEPQKFMDTPHVKSFFKQEENAKSIQNKIHAYTIKRTDIFKNDLQK